MNFTASQIFEITGALVVGFLAMLLSYRMPVKYLAGILIVLLPFQFIDTRFGSINVAIVYLFTFFLYIRKSLVAFPLMWPSLLVLFCTLLSFTQVHPTHNISHLVYIFALVSAFMIMVIVYNFVVNEEDVHFIFKLLLFMNVLVVIYSALQISAGGKDYVELVGGLKISIIPARGGGDNRLAGPFGVTMPGLFAEYLVISCLLIAYQVIFTSQLKQRVFLGLLAISNLGCLVATGNRGGLIGIVLFFVLFLFLMKNKLGMGHIIKIILASCVFFVIAAIFIVNYTSYNRLFERLGDTNIEEGVPDTRAVVWPEAIARFEEKPILGHGPRLWLHNAKEINYPDYHPIDFPHNLYLYLLCTVGLVGLTSYILFWLGLLVTVANSSKGDVKDEFISNFPKLSILLILYILFDQIKIEYARYNATDYWHFLFAMFGLFLGMAERKRRLVASSFREKFSSPLILE